MGIGTWCISGLAAAAVARLLPFGRSPRWALEAGLALTAALLAGLAATALDFGGWREPDWRAGTLSFAVAAVFVGSHRLMRMMRQ